MKPPRVQITYDVRVGNNTLTKELPFVIGIISNLAGDGHKALARYRERRFCEINRQTFNLILHAIRPTLNFTVDNCLTPDSNTPVSVNLEFKNIEDFNPTAVAQQIPLLAKLISKRKQLRFIINHLINNQELSATEVNATQTFISDFKSRYLEQHIIVEQDLLCTCHFIIAKIDQLLTQQMNVVIHHPKFQQLEAAWRGLHYLVTQTKTNKQLLIKIFCATRSELQQDLEKAIEFDQSHLFKQIYEEEFGTLGGAPFSILIGDYEFSHSARDIALLQHLGNVAACAHAPLISAASPELFDIDHFTQLADKHDLQKIFRSTLKTKWNAFRASEDSRYIALVLPRILLRLPYSIDSNAVREFNFNETQEYLWGNAAYALAQRIGNAFTQHGWCAAINGLYSGGLVEHLPTRTFNTYEGPAANTTHTEACISDGREKELNDLGFIALCHRKNSSQSVFYNLPTLNLPKRYYTEDATTNAYLSSQLPYILSASRFAHYIKAIMRDKTGQFSNALQMEEFLNDWISNYVLLNTNAPLTLKATNPLSDARIQVREKPAKPGSFDVIMHIKPHFQLNVLVTSIRLVTNLDVATSV